jgi:nucleotide-binding universal stress UspA family protein
MKILIATDGSQFSEAATEKACELMDGRENVDVKVISIYEPAAPMANEPFAISAEYYQQLENAGKAQAEAAVKKAAEFIAERMAIPVTEVITAVGFGNPAQVIVEAAEKWEADLVVVGSHGYGFWRRLALGSVSSAVLNHAPCSVLVVKAQP